MYPRKVKVSGLIIVGFCILVTCILLNADVTTPITQQPRLDCVAISLPKRRRTHFLPLQSTLKAQGISLKYFPGIDGRTLDPAKLNLSNKYKLFFEVNSVDRTGKVSDYRGHLGCTLAHLAVIKSIKRDNTIIFEDDACPAVDFGLRIDTVLKNATAYEPMWEILMLGFSSNYKDHPLNKLNDKEPVSPDGFVRLHYWLGQWAYVVRSKIVAQKITNHLKIIPWHIDVALAEMCRFKKLTVLGVFPPLVNHPGVLRLSSFDYYQKGDLSKIKSDTHCTTQQV